MESERAHMQEYMESFDLSREDAMTGTKKNRRNKWLTFMLKMAVRMVHA